MSPFLRASFSLFFPVGFIRSPITVTTPSRMTVLVDEVTAVTGFIILSNGSEASAIFRSSFMNSGLVPQHPPIIPAPFATISETMSAKPSGDTSYTVSPSLILGSPAFACTITGTLEYSSICSTTGMSSSGPMEQLTPTASAPRLCRVMVPVRGSVPVNVLPSSW